MHKQARHIMTRDPACCLPETTLNEVAQMMVQYDCGEIPVVDRDDRLIGVVTDRDIVSRVVATGRNPLTYTAASCMTQPAVSIGERAAVEEVLSTMERYQIRRVPVVDGRGHCSGIIAQADIARAGTEHDVAELVREVSQYQ
jgi:CBS domain-containing protein